MLRIALLFFCASLTAQSAEPRHFKTVAFGCYSQNLEEFTAFAQRAKQSGATHIIITAEDLPWARWQYDTPGDPYPAWIISNHGILKVAVPDALKAYIPSEYSETVLGTLTERCRVLKQLGLRAVYISFEPQILPEKVYEAHPLWRGPQVDNPIRSRVPRFAANIDNPEVLALYREALRKLTSACPEIDTYSFHTNDSGSGMSWSGGLYPGQNGDTFYESRPMDERYRAFFAAFRAGANDAGAGSLDIDIVWDREKAPALIAAKLDRGTAIANLEGPAATPYKAEVGSLLDYFYPFYPACGIPVAATFVEQLQRAYEGSAPRILVMFGDRYDKDLYFSLYDAFAAHPTHGSQSRYALLRDVAARRVGAEGADHLTEAWLALARAEQDDHLIGGNDGGNTLFYTGSVHQRWLTRPFVPFPQQLRPEEKEYYRRFQFQATTETRAEDLNDLQGTRDFIGRGGQVMVGRICGQMLKELESARRDVKAALPAGAPADSPERRLNDRFLAFECLIRNCADAVSYQYYLDISRQYPLKRPYEIGPITSIPERAALRQIARAETDNTARLLELLASGRKDLIALAPSPAEADIRILEPDLADSLRKKMKLMIAHWTDYERLFTTYDGQPHAAPFGD